MTESTRNLNVTTVKLGDLGKNNRMDAGYFNAIAPVKDDIDRLKQMYSKEEATEKLKAIQISPARLNFLLPLVRGSRVGTTLTKKHFESVIKTDPHAVMALVSHYGDKIRADIAREKQELEQKELEIGKAISGFKP